MKGTARRASKALGDILDAVYDWEAAVDKFFATGSDDDDVVVIHDSRGALIGIDLRPGLQSELTTEELEAAVNAAIARNVTRAQEGLEKISAQFQARCEQISAELGEHPVGDELVAALAGAR